MLVVGIIMFFVAILFPTMAHAQTVGNVVAARGDNIISRDGKTYQVDAGASVLLGDNIITKDRSFLVISMIDGTKITVRPETEFIINQFSIEKNATDLNLLSGGLRIVTGSIAKNYQNKFVVSTQTALLGVRGTEFSIFICDDIKCY